MSSAARSRAAVRHPLEALDPAEIRAAAAAVRAAQPDLDDPRFAIVALREPDKDAVRAVDEAGAAAPPREADVVVLERGTGTTYEGVVDLDAGRLAVWQAVPGVQPPILVDEIMRLEEMAQRDPRVREALARRGIGEDVIVQFDPWSAGGWPVEGVEASRRLILATAYVRRFDGDNGYARPIANLVVVVDPNAEEVLEVLDGEPLPLPDVDGNYDIGTAGPPRDDLRPLEIRQPEGVSFTVDGGEIRWQRWRLRAALHPVDGLVLHRIGYEDAGRVRPIVYRASVAEMVVPYGDPDATFRFRNVFDAGEYGLGTLTGSLELGCDCLGEITYLDGVIADGAGEPQTIRNAICIHEEDFGILWKHWDFRYSETAEVRRSRRLVVSSIATIGNYEYGFYWHFYLDGTIELVVKATGIVQTKGLADGQRSPYGTLLAPRLDAPNHQHLFNVRLDMEVDGPANTVHEVDLVGRPAGPENPHGNAIVAQETPIERESEGGRFVDPRRQRAWHVRNQGSRNGIGDPVGYRLEPHGGPLLLADPDQVLARRAAFATRDLWVTRYHRDELRAGGDYPNQHPGGAGLPEWTAQDRELVDTDVVLWHTFGMSHQVRPEDWPVMPVDMVSFRLRPFGFFDRNPALDVPPPEHGCHPAG